MTWTMWSHWCPPQQLHRPVGHLEGYCLARPGKGQLLGGSLQTQKGGQPPDTTSATPGEKWTCPLGPF
eukprot:4695326-Amphidinium_carterae.1